MQRENLLTRKHNVYSQNGEDGIIETLFQRIGPGQKICCEFGAWDGVYLSNCRKLILEGWRAVMIEGNAQRHQSLVKTYATNPNVACLNRFVDTERNSLDAILQEQGIRGLDFLSIDIDGLDYDLLAGLKLQPRVICIEVSAGYHPSDATLIPASIAQHNVGRPLLAFTRLAHEKGYRLVCYNANAFLVQEALVKQFSLPDLSAQEAYEDFLSDLDAPAREWLYLVNLGLNTPFYKYNNSFLSRRSLGIAWPRAARLWVSAQPRGLKSILKKHAKKVLGR